MSNTMITSLTEEQKKDLADFAAGAIERALRVRPIDKAASESAIKRIYELAKLEPQEVFWVRSPMEGAFEASRRALALEAERTGKRPGSLFWHPWINGAWWAAFKAFGLAVRDVLGVDLGSAARDFSLLYENGLDDLGFYWFNRDFCLASERPTTLLRDAAGRLHAESGPAIEWSDGFGLFVWHGTVVPREWIENRGGLDPKAALTHPNVEQRRAAAEIIGWSRVLEAVGARVVDEDRDPQIGTLLEADLPDAPASRFLRVRCGTGRDFVLPVPQGMRDALEANAWTYGLEKGAYAPEVRT